MIDNNSQPASVNLIYDQNTGEFSEVQGAQPSSGNGPSFQLPPHKNKLALSILATIFCCQIGGIIAIVYSVQSNSAYNSALLSKDDAVRQSLYIQSEKKNSTANTWLIVSLCVGLFVSLVYIICLIAGVADY